MRVIPYFQLESFTEEEGIFRRTHKRRSRSFVENFLKLHFILSSETGTNVTMTDVDGTSRSIGATSVPWYLAFQSSSPGRGGAGIAYFGRISTNAESPTVKGSKSTNNGIQLGTGSTAVTPTDFKLATAIADGTAASTLEYFSCAGTGLTVSGATGSFVIERLFRNSSGGTITVNEIGLYSLGGEAFQTGGSQGLFHFMVLRDIVSPGFDIVNGAYARATYTISITV